MMKYLLDANIFIQAKNLHYGFDFCPAFWRWIEEQNKTGKVASIKQVQDELVGGQDELSDWAREQGRVFFLPPDDLALNALGEVSAWVTTQNYAASAISTFLDVADVWLIAYASAHGWTIVTHERPENSVKKIKIPNVCTGMEVNFMNPYTMLRREHARFVLG